MKLFPLVISSPDGDLFRGDILKITLRGSEGDLAILAGHIPFVTAVKAGKVKIELDDEDRACQNGSAAQKAGFRAVFCHDGITSYHKRASSF